ncbi:MAG: hypothetical protein EXS50_00320 [Candidatus Taylorbacteria bacterium]|nr:hypothetical protein [Candidatus Taylorbacteria bacterium]
MYNNRVQPDYISFIKNAPTITIVGVVGDEGKTTTAYVLHEILAQVYKPPQIIEDKIILTQSPSVFWLNEESDLVLLLKKLKREDIVIVELNGELVAKFDEAGISVAIAVCTNSMPVTHSKELGHMLDHALIFKRQSSNNFIIIGEDTFDHIKKVINFRIKSKVIFKKAEDVPREWKIAFPGYHNKENIALAIGVTELFKIEPTTIRTVVEKLTSLVGRLQLVKNVRGVDIYNDASSKTPGASLAALQTLSHNRNIVIIIGGRDTGFDSRFLLSHLSQYAHGVVVLAGTGTLPVHRNILSISTVSHAHAQNLDEAVEKGLDMCRDGDILLFSPAFGAVSEADRSEEFLKVVENIV